MKKILLFSVFCFALVPVFPPGSVWADTITVIHDDGRKDVVDMGVVDLPPVPDVVPPAAPDLAPEVESVPELETVVEPVPARVPVSVPGSVVKPVLKAAEPSEAVVEQVTPSKVPQKKPRRVAAKKPKAKKDEAKLRIKPKRKPYRPVLPVFGGQEIDEGEALLIALSSSAPPSRDVRVSARDGVYVVGFQAEAGLYEVLVDQASGVIVSERYVTQEETQVKPGHLPVR